MDAYGDWVPRDNTKASFIDIFQEDSCSLKVMSRSCCKSKSLPSEE